MHHVCVCVRFIKIDETRLKIPSQQLLMINCGIDIDEQIDSLMQWFTHVWTNVWTLKAMHKNMVWNKNLFNSLKLQHFSY